MTKQYIKKKKKVGRKNCALFTLGGFVLISYNTFRQFSTFSSMFNNCRFFECVINFKAKKKKKKVFQEKKKTTMGTVDVQYTVKRQNVLYTFLFSTLPPYLKLTTQLVLDRRETKLNKKKACRGKKDGSSFPSFLDEDES
jgi:hypothetical protein